MKKQIIFPALLTIVAVACSSDKTQSFIVGTYVNSAKSEYSIANDTLVIEAAESNRFLIYRKTGITLIRNGEIGKEQHEQEEWQALYDEGSKTLTESKRGKRITPLPEANKLLVERREYTKID
jgi:UDP-N-acetylmuramate-alanine ligase